MYLVLTTRPSEPHRYGSAYNLPSSVAVFCATASISGRNCSRLIFDRSMGLYRPNSRCTPVMRSTEGCARSKPAPPVACSLEMISSLFDRRELDVDAGFLLEVRGHIRRHIVGPGDDAQTLGAVDAGATADPQAQEQRREETEFPPCHVVFLLRPRRPHAPGRRRWCATPGNNGTQTRTRSAPDTAMPCATRPHSPDVPARTGHSAIPLPAAQ